MSQPKRYRNDHLNTKDGYMPFFHDGEGVTAPEGDYVLHSDYAELERRHQTIMDAIESMGSLENIRRVEVSQPIVIDMAHENACMKWTISRLIEAGDALIALLKDEGYQTEPDPEDESDQGMSEVVAWNEAKRTKEYDTIAVPRIEGGAK